MNNADRAAYPQSIPDVKATPDEALEIARNAKGLTKFEKVAAMAMQGFASSADVSYGTPQEVAKDGIAAAHAFFKELE